MTPAAVIIGAGVAGLASAALLAREGLSVTVLEQNGEAGGRAGEATMAGFRFDTGPSWFLMPGIYDRFYRLLDTSLEEQLELLPLEPGYRVYTEPGAGARAVDVSPGADSIGALFESLEPGSSAALVRHLASARRWLGIAEATFLYNTFRNPAGMLTPELLRRLPEALRLAPRSLASMVSASFGNTLARQLLTYPALFLGSDPRSLPSIYHLMSALDLVDGVLYPRGGFAAVVRSLENLALAAGARISYDARVTRIATRAGRAVGVEFLDRDGGLMLADADVVVSAADLHHTETALLDPKDRSYPESWWRRRVSGPGAVIGLLGVEGELPELLHHNLFFTRDWDANFDDIFGARARVPAPASLYVSRTSATEPGDAPDGAENLFVLVPVPADPRLGRGGDHGAGEPQVEAVLDAALEQIGSWAGIPGLKKRVVARRSLGPGDFSQRFNSWRGGMLGPAHTMRQSAMFRVRNRSPRVQGLYYAGATVSPGIGVPMCLISAELVLKLLRGDDSPGPLAGLP